MTVKIDLNKVGNSPVGGNQPNNATLSGVDNRTDDLVTIRLQEAGKQSKTPKSLNSRVTLFNDLGAGVRSFKINQQIEDAYKQLRASVVDFTNDQSLGAPQNAKEVHFNLSKMSVMIKYENGTEETLDLQALIEDPGYPHIKERYESLESLVNPIWGGSMQNAPIEKGRKSSSKGKPPMQRGSHVVLNSLPTDHVKCLEVAKSLLGSCVKPELKVQREQEAEVRINALAKAIDAQIVTLKVDLQREDGALQALIQEKSGQNPRADIDQQMKITSEKLHKLKELEIQLNDRLGLYIAAAFMPASTSGLTESEKLKVIENAATAAEYALHTYIDKESEPFKNEGVKTTWPAYLPGFIRGTPKTIPDYKDFSTDVAALIFSSLPVGLARRGALDFWTGQGIAPKSECIADELIRFAFADGEKVSMLDGIDGTDSIRNSLNVLKSETKTIFPKAPRDQDLRIHLEGIDRPDRNNGKEHVRYPMNNPVFSGPTIEDLPLRGEDGYVSSDDESI